MNTNPLFDGKPGRYDDPKDQEFADTLHSIWSDAMLAELSRQTGCDPALNVIRKRKPLSWFEWWRYRTREYFSQLWRALLGKSE